MRAAWRRIPRAGRILTVVAVLNALAWTLVIPPGQIPDEDSQIAYSQYLAETGKLPTDQPGRSFSPDFDAVLGAVLEFQQNGRPYIPPVWSRRLDRGLRDVEHRHLSDVGGGDAEAATDNPPLYYLLTAVPYHLGDSATLVDRIYLMRFLSVLLAGLTTLCAYLFVREVLPRRPWAWALGGAAVAFQPMFAFMSAGVHVDDLANALAALELLLVARAFRRGLTVRRGAGIGGVLALGLLTKGIMTAFVPVALWTLGWTAWRLRERRPAARAAGAAAAAFAAPMAIYEVLVHSVWHRGLYTGAGGFVSAAGVGGHPFRWSEYLEFTWQLALPRLPFMHDWFLGPLPIRDTFLYGLVGRFGWLDYGFSPHVDHLALDVVLVLLALVAVSAVRHRAALLRRWPELLAYAGAVVGVFAVIGLAAYRARLNGGTTFEQARYLLPLLAVYGLAMGFAAAAVGRWGRVLAAALVVMVLGHDLFGQLLSIQRYYT